MPQTTEYKYIHLNEQGVPTIAGTRMKVIDLITSVKAYGWSPEELGFQYPHLTMGQIHSALAYYWDHQEEMDTAIEQGRQAAELLKAQATDSPFVARMRANGLLQ